MKLLVTGSAGLIGSEVVNYFSPRMNVVYGFDTNMRKKFFGPDGNVSPTIKRLKKTFKNYRHYSIDIRDERKVSAFFKREKPDYIVHAAGQPSHDLASKIPLVDFDVNARGTLIVLEAMRQHTPHAVFVLMSTNKVYGDMPNKLALRELDTRYDYNDPLYKDGIDETMSIDDSIHSCFGVSKAAADLYTQEYGKNFGLNAVSFRCGCLTGPNHQGAELHGFLSYLAKCVLENRSYTIYGYKGKQVRDNIHSYDVATAIEEVFNAPLKGEVYNLGGGRENSCSMLEAISLLEEKTKKKLQLTISPQHRTGDHICYISNLSKFRSAYPSWEITRKLEHIIEELRQK